MTATASVEAPAAPDLLHRLHTSFGGVVSSQVWADYYLWELVLNNRPDLGAILEIGTWQGGFSRYLYAQARARGMEFWTCDVIEPDEPPPGYFQLDVWARPEVITERIALFHPTPVILLCDGGNKPREAATFGPACPPGSLIVVHDWGTEFLPGHVPPGFVEVHGDVCDALGSMSRIFEPPS